jgi:hypothetical protein
METKWSLHKTSKLPANAGAMINFSKTIHER